MMLFDLGTLQVSSSVQHLLLVTGDGFHRSAAACFDGFQANPSRYYGLNEDSLESIFDDPKIILKQSFISFCRFKDQPIFRAVSNCAEATRIVGRLFISSSSSK